MDLKAQMTDDDVVLQAARLPKRRSPSLHPYLVQEQVYNCLQLVGVILLFFRRWGFICNMF
jgi:hypothetical protein